MCADAHCIWNLKPHGDASGSGVLSYRSFPLASRHWRSLSPTVMQTCRLALARSVMVSAWSIWGLPGAAHLAESSSCPYDRNICVEWFRSCLIGETSAQDASRHHWPKERIGLGGSRIHWIDENTVRGGVLELPDRRNLCPGRFQESSESEN